MKVLFGGVRGTGPVAQADFLRYGGETTSVLIEGAAGERLLLDAGTGMRIIAPHLQLAAGGTMRLLMTHYHLDHLAGLPSFPLLYRRNWTLEVAAPLREKVKPEEVVRRLLAKPFWPVQLEKLRARLRFVTLSEDARGEAYEFGGLCVRWCPLCHPEGCHAYRIDEPATGAAFVFATDVEWAASTVAQQDALLALCAEPTPATWLAFDGQFTPSNYPRHRGWGHSTWADAVEVAHQTGVGRLLLTHHAPENNDQKLDAIARALAAAHPNAQLATDGLQLQS